MAYESSAMKKCKERKEQGRTNFVIDKRRAVFKIARRYYGFLVDQHYDEVKSVADAADFLFVGTRVKYDEFSRIVQRRLYWTAKNLGWKQFKPGGWKKVEGEYHEERG